MTTPVDLPGNAEFPWNNMIEMTYDGDRGIGLSLGAIHEQLCVIADLLRAQSGRQAALERRVNRIAEAVGE